jgi:hypothetical protein
LNTNEHTYLGNKVKASLSLLLLKLEGDTTDGTALNSLHQVSDETSNLISHSLGRNNGNLSDELLVDMEIKSEARVVFLDDHSGRLLDGFCSHTLYIPSHISTQSII